MPRTGRRQVRLVVAGVALGLVLACLAGCGGRDYYKDPPVEPEPLAADVPEGVPPVTLDAGVAEPVRSDAPLVPVTREITMDPRKPKDKNDKADIYWKLVYLAGTGGARRPPTDLKAQCAGTVSDDAKQIIGQIIAALEKANDAYVARRTPGRPGSVTDDLPWGAGQTEFDGALAPSAEDISTPAAAAKARKRLQDFNARYQLPPELVRNEAISEAKTLLSELLQTLNDERKRDGDFPITSDKATEFRGPDIGPEIKPASPDDLVISPP